MNQAKVNSNNTRDENVKIQKAGPNLKCETPIFGTDLTTLLSNYDINIPFVITKCITEIEARGLTIVGIYRKNGPCEQTDIIRETFEKDKEKTDLSPDKCPDIHVITGTLRLYLRKLPEFLISSSVHSLLIDAIQQDNLELKLSLIKDALLSLPKAHYTTLQYIIQHLHRVSLHAAVNKMDTHNLAILFIFVLMDFTKRFLLYSLDHTTEIEVLETLIVHCDSVFVNS